MSLEAGQKLGPYEIIEQAGAGGMGEVYKATDSRLNRTVAIKILPESMAISADFRSRFDREAKAISSLNHPNICTLYDIGDENGMHYLVMEFLEGETLADRLNKGALELTEANTIAVQICDALDKAHRQGLIHRDLKPGNIMLTDGGAKLMDFGLAKLTIIGGAENIQSQITQTTPLTGAGTILGTMQYMAPEQLEGEEADGRSDIFAFGLIIYEMLTGLKAFEGKSQAGLIAGIIGQEPRPISDIKPMTPPGMVRLIKKCLAKDPDNRWQSSRDLADELRWVSQGSQAGIPAPLAAKRKFKFNLARAIGLVAIIMVLGLSYLYYSEISKPQPVIKTSIIPDLGSELGNFAGGDVIISPAGDKIAFMATDSIDNNMKLWVRSLNTLTAFPLKGTKNATFPFWSPDGEYLAFFADSKMKKILSTGGPVLTICEAETGRPGDWNKDNIIIFTPEFTGPIYSVHAAGGEAKQLTSLDTTRGDFTHRYARFLPDGDHFLFYNRLESNSGGEKDQICVSSISDTSISHLFYAKSNADYANGQLLFMRENILMAHKFNPSSLTLEGNAHPLAEDVSYHKAFSRGIFSISDNGHLFYRKGEVKNGSYLKIYTIGENVIDTVGELEDQQSYALSNDNRYIAVEIEDEQTSESDIWIYDTQRSIKRRFTFDSESDWFPVWSPDDSQIVFGSSRNDETALYIKNTYGTEPPVQILTSETRILLWDWTKDGKYIIYSEFVQGNIFDIKIYSVDNQDNFTDTVYLATEFFEGGSKVSPDGRWMTYTSNESGTFQIYVSTFPKHTVKWQVSVKDGGFSKWSIDGKKIYFVDSDFIIHMAEVNGSGNNFEVGQVKPVQQLNDGPPPGFELFNNQQKILTSDEEENSEIDEMIHVLNWPEETTK